MHLLFVLPTSLLNFSFAWGRAVNVFLFWVTGLPGGVTYALLVAVKAGRLSPLREKAVSAALNTWLRTPGLVTFSTIMCAAALHGLTRVPAMLAFLVAALGAANGLFYGKQAVESFVKRREGAAVGAAADGRQKDAPGGTPAAAVAAAQE